MADVKQEEITTYTVPFEAGPDRVIDVNLRIPTALNKVLFPMQAPIQVSKERRAKDLKTGLKAPDTVVYEGANYIITHAVVTSTGLAESLARRIIENLDGKQVEDIIELEVHQVIPISGGESYNVFVNDGKNGYDVALIPPLSNSGNIYGINTFDYNPYKDMAAVYGNKLTPKMVADEVERVNNLRQNLYGLPPLTQPETINETREGHPAVA